MNTDALLRVAGIVLAPMVAFLTFMAQEGRRRSRLAKRAKTATDLLAAAPADSPLHAELARHHEREVRAYLDAHRPRARGPLTDLVLAVFVGFLGAVSLLGAIALTMDPGNRTGVLAVFTQEPASLGKAGVGFLGAAVLGGVSLFSLVSFLRPKPEG